MAAQLLFYEQLTPLNRQAHGGWSLENVGGFNFAEKSNAVPLLAVEFLRAASQYPIVFTPQGEDEFTPVAILGLSGQKNVFVGSDGSWQADYIPAFVRRYPFVFALSDDRSQYTLCIDESYAGFNASGKGQALFHEDGKPSDYVQGILKFLQDYEQQMAATRRFCRNLVELGLLEASHLQFKSPSGQEGALTGFHCVNRSRLKGLSGTTLARVMESDELELLFAHLHSLRNFAEVHQRQPAPAAKPKGKAASKRS